MTWSPTFHIIDTNLYAFYTILCNIMLKPPFAHNNALAYTLNIQKTKVHITKISFIIQPLFVSATSINYVNVATNPVPQIPPNRASLYTLFKTGRI